MPLAAVSAKSRRFAKAARELRVVKSTDDAMIVRHPSLVRGVALAPEGCRSLSR